MVGIVRKQTCLFYPNFLHLGHETNIGPLGYGGPITFRIAQRRPELFASYILQNSNAYEEGLGPAMIDAAPYLTNRNIETEKLVKPLLTLDGMFLARSYMCMTRVIWHWRNIMWILREISKPF